MNFSSRIAWVSAFFFSVALFYAPLAYGCTRPEMLPTLYGLLIIAMVIGVASFVASGRRPAIPKALLLCAAAVLVQGWWMTWYPALPDVVASHGGMVDVTVDNIRQVSFDSMLMTTVLLGSFLVLYGLFAEPLQRRFVLLAATLSGVLVCLIGVILKIGGEPLMRYVWRPEDLYWNDFAFFHYHGNAGTFLILVWPLILVFTRRAYAPRGGKFKKMVWTLFSLLCAAALILNSSKAALVIGLLILPWPFMTWLMRLRRPNQIFLGAVALLFISVFLAGSTLLTREPAFQRLSHSAEVYADAQARWDDYKVDFNAVPDVGWFGLGPGLYKVAFPYQMSSMRNAGGAVHDYAHEDYLQTVLEWGYFGTFWWTFLVAGGLYRAFRTYSRRESFTSKTERHLVLAAILGVVGTLAQALLDFPLQIASLRFFFLVLLALCWASPECLTRRPRQSSRRRFQLVIPAEPGVEAEAGVD